MGEWRKWSRVAFNLTCALASVTACAYTGHWEWALTAASFGIATGTSVGLVWLADMVKAAEREADERERRLAEAIEQMGAWRQ